MSHHAIDLLMELRHGNSLIDLSNLTSHLYVQTFALTARILQIHTDSYIECTRQCADEIDLGTVEKEHLTSPFIGDLPFPEVLLTFSTPLGVSEEEANSLLGEKVWDLIKKQCVQENLPLRYQTLLVEGVLITKGRAIRILKFPLPMHLKERTLGDFQGTFRYMADVMYSGGKWSVQSLLTAEAFAIPRIFERIGSLKRPARKSPLGRKIQRAQRRHKGKLEKDTFYEIQLRPPSPKTPSLSGSSSSSAPLSFRHDVSSHTRTLIRTGSSEEIQRYARLGGGKPNLIHPDGSPHYRIYSPGEYPDVPTHLWCAVKVIRIPAHVKGPEDAPYKPAIRKV